MLGLGEGCRMKGLLRGDLDLDIAYEAMLGRVLENFGLTSLTVLAAAVRTGWDLEEYALEQALVQVNTSQSEEEFEEEDEKAVTIRQIQ
nr:hypothetical protein [Tanacetum cinerariifolium]